jgi:hypothetical protein
MVVGSNGRIEFASSDAERAAAWAMLNGTTAEHGYPVEPFALLVGTTPTTTR